MTALGTSEIIRADSRHLPIADNSVDLIVTSPPYFALRSYQDGGEHYDGQIGDEPTPAEFVDALLEVTRECVRVLKQSGSLWVNLGDKYAGSTRHMPTHRGNVSEHASRGMAESQRAGVPDMDTGDIRPKSLIGIPWRYALRCIDDLGLILRAEVIWSKPNGLPESVTDRVRRSHEQWFHFTLSPRYFSAVDEIREEHNSVSWIGRDKQERANSDRNDGGKMANTANPLGKLPGSVWTVPTQPLRVPEHLGIDHFAAFPMEWPRRIIQGWSPSGVCVECGEGRRPVSERESHGPEGVAGRISSVPAAPDGREGARKSVRVTVGGYTCACCSCGLAWVGHPNPHSAACKMHTPPPTMPAVILDPFGGTGTTALVAKALGRHGISVDMSADYCRLAQWRTNDENELARALQVDKPARQIDGQASLLDLLGEASA